MDIHRAIGKLPRPKRGFVWPRHKYTGPWNPLHEQLDANDLPIDGQEPYNAVDKISMYHDICYRDNHTDKKGCDDVMLNELNNLKPKDWGESIDKKFIHGIMSAKKKLGVGIKWTNNLAEELHKPVRKNFTKRFVFVRNSNDIWAADLIDLRSHSKKNDGMKYILMVIDVFSKYGWAVPIKFKTGSAVADAFKQILDTEAPPKKLWVDEGKEFLNKIMDRILKKHGIEIYSTHNDEKCSVVERWNRTIKTKLWKYFSANGTYRYIDVLQALIDKYNNTRHRSTGLTPIEARKLENHEKVFKNLYFKKVQDREFNPRFKVGDEVRITKKKKLFDKGYTNNWTHKIYTIAEVLNTFPPTYKIKDDKGVFEGSFYEAELQKTNENVFQIEKILGWKMIDGERYGRVKWKGYDSSYNSWVPAKEIKHVRDY